MTQKKSLAPEAPELNRYMVLILGMHRSGTSALAGMMHHLGCTLPKQLMPASDSNSKGYFESNAAFKFNDDLLSEAGTDWRDWRPISSDWFASPVGQALLPQARDLLDEEFGSSPLVVFKDPRICRMVPFWRNAAAMAGFQTLPVLIHRNPLEVARSLRERDGIDIAESLLIWLRHCLDAEMATRSQPRFITSYDQILKNWSSQIIRLQRDLDLILPRFDARTSAKIEDFLSPQLQHFTELPEYVNDNPTVSKWVVEAYSIFERWVVTGETKEDYGTLDRIRSDLEAAGPVFSQLIDAKTSRIEMLDNQVSELKSEENSLSAKLIEREKQVVELDTERAKLRQDLEARQSETARLQSKIDALDTKLSERERQITERDAERARLYQALESRQAETTRLNSEIAALGTKLSEREKQVTERDTEHVKLKQALETREAETARLRKDLAEVEQDYIGQSQLADQVRQELDDARNALSQTESALAQRRLEAEQTGERAETAEADLAEKSEELEKLTARSHDQIRELAEMARLLQQGDEKLTTVQIETERLQGETAAQDEKLTTVQIETERLQGETAAQQAHINFLESELQAMRTSTFWRMTKPLRILVDTLRGHR